MKTVDRVNSGERVCVALSGGVDSAVAAALLIEAGCDVVGLTLTLAAPRDALGKRGGVGSDESLETEARARKVASELSVPIHVMDATERFRASVLEPCWREYERGCTPNPCVLCNPSVKLATLLEGARDLGAAWVATGHHARVEACPLSGGHRLVRGSDRAKDQSYFLYALSQEQLKATLFPVGAMSKQEVRRIAARRGLGCASSPESQDVCFVDDKASFPEVLKDALGDGAGAGERPGKIVDTSGRALGTHRGVYRYTIGQRKGLGVASTERLYVVELRPSSAEVVLGPQEELYGDTMEVGAVRWAPGFPPDGPLEGEVQIRYRHRAAPATITARRDGRGAEVVFRDPQKSITPGQAAVFYRDDLVIGGGRIDGQ